MKHKKSNLLEERQCFKPFNYSFAYNAWLAHEQSHWGPWEAKLGEDVKDWKKNLTVAEKNLLTHIFRFFTQADIDVAGAYVKNYLPYFPQPEVRMMLLGFASREAVHIAAYSHLIETLGLPETTYNEFAQYQEMKEKHEYLLGVSATQNTKADTAVHMAVFSGFTEGMQLFSSFIMLLNFSRQGKMRGMKDIITWSIRDEMMHCDGMTKLFREYVKENLEIWNDTTKSRIYAAAEKMVELEDKFIDLAFAMGDLVDLTKEEVKVYIRYITDRRLIGLGLKGIYKVKRNPLRWVEEIINSPIHGNFFETVVTDYAKGALTGSWDEVWA